MMREAGGGHHIPQRRGPSIDTTSSGSPIPLTVHAKAASHSHAQPATWIDHPGFPPLTSHRLRHLMNELYRQDPEAAIQLSTARTQKEFLSAVCDLFNLSRTLSLAQHTAPNRATLAETMTDYLNRTLHTGPTLKTLAQFLGYSEKYCSDLFRSAMGESFSRYLKRRKTDYAVTLLMTTDKSVSEIASILGFSDPFTFSHFFKRATGQSPRTFRTTQTRARHHRASGTLSTRFSRF